MSSKKRPTKVFVSRKLSPKDSRCPFERNGIFQLPTKDTSASMNQKTCLGTTYLDIAKGAVESFIKIRSRDSASRGDRYMLVTFDEPPNCVKAGWRENQATFYEELKNVQANSLSGLGPALKESFDLLNLHRLQSGIDNYGMGRNPYYLEPALIITITDNGKLTNTAGMLPELHLPMHNQLPGCELTKEPFRWDQRMFSLILRIPGTPTGLAEKLTQPQFNAEEATITAMCEVTGGKSYVITTHKSLIQSLESIVQKIQPGVVINFEKVGPDPDPGAREGTRTPGNLTPKREDDTPSPACPVEIGGNKKALQVPPIVNGIIPPYEATFKPIKSDAQDSSSTEIPDNPIRGNEQPQNDQLIPNQFTTTRPSTPSPPSNAWQNVRKMIFVRSNPKVAVGHWPIPESFWPDPGAQNLPPRDAQPVVLFSCTDAEPMVIDNLPFDKYELEPSPLTQFILERKQPHSCWQTFVNGSGREGGVGQPFGYIKASTNLLSVNFFVMPYNYPVLLPLLDELFKVLKMKPSLKWRQSFEHYLSTMPSYYAVHLKNAMRRMGVPSGVVPDHIDGSLSFTVISYLKKVKHQAKVEADRLINLVGKKPPRDNINRPLPSVPQLGEDKQTDYRLLLRSSRKDRDKYRPNTSQNLSEESVPYLTDRGLPVLQETFKVHSFRNPFDIPRQKLTNQLKRMRVNFFHMSATSTKLQDQDIKHSVSISQMGNYQEYLKVFAPLREVDPGQARVHTFGNPFKLKQDQQQFIAIDEADVNEALAGPGVSQKKRQGDTVSNFNNKKRKRSETPPPSRRPVGPPNTPPPRPIIPPLKVENIKIEHEIQRDTVETPPQVIKAVNNLDHNREQAVQNQENIDKRTEKTDKSIEKSEKILENGVSPEKKTVDKSVNRQLRKLQKLHKIKQAKNIKVEQNEIINNDSSSPILSILRTALVDGEEGIKTEESNEGDVEIGVKRKLDNDLNVVAAKQVKVELVEQNKIVRDLSPAAIQRRCRLQLQTSGNIKIRQEVWKEIRSQRRYDHLSKYVKSISGSSETKCLFLTDLIEEAEKFKLTRLIEKLKTLSRTLESEKS